MTGASGWVPLATAAEATRSWAKSVARQWAGARVGVNCVATALPVVLGDGSTDPVPAYIGVGFTAGIEPSVADVRAAVDALIGPLSSHLTGATVTVDGGVHMEP
jgi:NAD(P)-dependent dehydrogenase (short-subunit alcohol dehydrogenase family)